MTTDRPTGGCACDDIEGSLSELALGILPGDERALVLAHLEECDRCRAEAESLADTADILLDLAPGVEPPIGFEVRLFERLGVSEPQPAAQRMSRRFGAPVTRWKSKGRALVAAAAVTVAVGLGFGAGWVANPGSTVATPEYYPSAATRTASLTSYHQVVGTVSVFHGSPGWMFMTVHGVGSDDQVICQVTLYDGQRVSAGTFRLDHGHGAWGASLPVPAQDILSAQVVGAGGAVLGSATFAS
jgi:anti-sigma-K factor RskA